MTLTPPQVSGPGVVGQSAYWGVAFKETGISVRRFQIRYFPEQDIRHQNYQGETFVRTISRYFSREVICEGEITSPSTGIMGFALGTVCTFANFVTHFNANYGTLLMDEATVNSDRRGWSTVSVKCSANPFL